MINLKTLSLSFIVLSSLLGHSVNAQVIPAYNERVEQQELEIRRLTGEVETLKYKNQNLEMKLNGLRKEMELRFEDLNNSKPTSHDDISQDKNEPDTTNNSQNDPVTKILSPTTESKSANVTVLYDAARAEMKHKNYDAAAKGFQRIIDQYPSHNLTANSYYWLGETYYTKKQYDKAALTFLEGKKKFPNSPKAGHNLLKLGLSLHYLNEKKEACLTFDQVEKYLKNDASLAVTLQNSRLKAGCSV